MNQGVLLTLALSMLLAFTSCSIKQDSGETGKCYSKSLSLMFIVDDQIRDYKNLPVNKDTQGEIRSGMVDSINYLAKKIIEMSGGFQAETGQLFDGCKELTGYTDFYNQYVAKAIGPLYNSLSVEDQNSKHFIDVLNTYFFADNSYLSEDYFRESKVFQLSNDLFTLQLSLVN